MAFNRELSQFANYLTLDASARYIGITTAVDANVGIGSVTPRSKLDVVGDALVTGITTSLGGFVGNLTGTASNATQAEGLTGTPNVTVNAVTSAHINNTGVVTASGGFVGALTGNASSATALANARNIGGVSFDGSSDINLPGVNAAGNQDTTGTAALAEGLTGTPSITVNAVNSSHINSSGIITAASFSGDGSGLTGVASTDNIQTATPAKFLNDVLITGISTVGVVTGGTSVSATNIYGTHNGNVIGNVTGDVTGNADTATALQNARNIGGVSFDGTGNINLPGVNISGNQDTSGNAATASTLETARTIGGISFNGGSDINLPGVNQAGNQDTSGNAATASTLENARTIGGVSFDGSSNIDLPGVNIAGNQNTSGTAAGLSGTPNITVNAVTSAHINNSGVTSSTGGFVGDLTGNAATATALANARTIGGVSFDGTSNINLPGVNATGNQDTSGNAATATALATGRNFTVSGDATTDSAQSFDGTGNVALPITLANSGVSAATYGSAAAIPVLTVDAKGRITSATTTAVGSGLTVTGDSGSEDIDLLTEGLAITGNGNNVITAASGNAVDITLNPNVAITDLSASGVVTATSFKTGATGSAIQVNTTTITGPSSITIDPAAIGDATGTVHILGNLQVEGTQTVIDSTTVNIADKNIQVATGAANNAAADGAGFTIDSGEGDKTFQYQDTGNNFASSENMNLADGKVYKIDNTEVLSETTLGSGVVNSSLTSVGTLDSLNVSGAITGAHVNLSGIVTASNFVATQGTMNITGDVTGTATTATNAQGLTGTPSITVDDITGTGNINIAGIVTASSFVGDLTGNVTGNADSATLATNAQGLTGTPNITVNAVTSAHINNSGIVTASSFSGSGSGLSAGTTPLTTLDIDGAADIGADLVDADLIVVDDGAGGTNRKSALSRVKEYVLGGGSGGNFAQIRVTGISTLGQATADGLVVSGVTTATGGVVGNLTGDVTGNADTATTLQNARTIGGVSFDGSANINLPGVNQAGNQNTSGNAATATALENARTIGGVSFDGTGNINLPGVNQSGNQDTSGNAATATTLETGRNFSASGDATASAVSFNGSGNVDLDLTLANTGVSAATYGSGSQVSQITVDSKGRITNATNVAISTSLQVSGGSGSGSVNLLVDGLQFIDGTFVNTSVAGTSVTIGLDATSNNTADNLVARDGSGNFSAGTISAALSGNVTGNVVGDVTGDLTGNADTATSLQTGRNFTVTGDATTDSAQSFDGTGNVALPITLANSGVSAGTYGGAAAVPVLTVDSKGRVTSATTTAVGSGLTVVGDSGSEDINLLSESLTISGGTNLSSNAASNGVTVSLNDDISITTAAVSGVVTASGGFVGNITGDVTGNASGNAGTATALQTSRNIGGVSFDGTANINLPGVNQEGNQDTTGNAATATVATNAQGLTGTPNVTVNTVTSAHINNSGVTTSATFVGALTGNVTGNITGNAGGNAATATALQNARTIGGVSFDGTGNINLPGVNQAGNQDTSGNAATASALETARTLAISGDATGSASFDGSANATISATLADSGVSAATYGSAAAIPVLTVDAKGRVTSATTTAVGSGLTVTGDSGSEDINLLTEGLAITGGTNLTSTAASNGVELSLDADVALTNLSASGVVTATSFKTGTEGSAIHINSATITGPSSITLDPAAIGDATGTVHILGNLQVEGTQTVIDSTTVNIVDKNIQIATGAANDAAADGGGITVDSGDGDKTFQFEATGDNFGSSENMNLASGKVYKVNNTEVLSATTLGGAVVNSSLTSVGTLGSLNVSGALTGAHINASGIVTASSFSGSGSGLSAGTTPLTTLDIDGATDIGADLSDADLIVVDDGAGGTNRKSAMSRVKEYVLGGGSGGNFEQLSVTGISTLGQATADGLVVSGVTTATGGVVGNLTGNVTGNADTATTLETARSIGGVSFDGSADINLPGVNQAGNQDTSGNAATASALETARTLAISGDASGSASFDGSANATISATLANTGVSAATYGSTTEVPVLTVDSKGRVTSATTAAVGSALTVTGDSGSEDINLLSEGLAITGGTNLTSAAASNGVAISLDNDISITTAAVSGVVTAGGGFVGDVTGDLTGDVTSTGLISAAHINASGVTTATGGFVGNVQGNVNSTGLSTVTNLEVGGYVSIGDTHGQMNQVLSSVGAGVTWKDIVDVLPQTRTTQTSTATAGQTAFSFDYNVNYLDVFINGVKLSSSELTATDGTSITLSEACFAGDIVEFHSYATAGAGTGQVSSSNDLSDVTLTSASNNDILVYDGSTFRNQQTLNLSGNIAAADLTLSGNLTVNGTQTVLNTASLNVEDLNITVANGAASAAAADGAGLTVDGASATFQYASTGDKWVANKSVEATSFLGAVTGNVTGNADTATTLQNARTIGGVSFDGSANINLPGVNATGNQDTSGNAATATALQNARTIGGVSFDGTSGINLPGVNQAGNQDTSGNAATASALETARNIGGVSFNGSADINLPGVNATGNQDTSGNAATATALATSRTLAISGDATGSASFDGSANATISATLANSGVSAATYGSTTEIPVIAIDAKGRVTSATTAAVGSGLTVAGDTGSEDINLLAETLTIAGGTNLTSAAASNGVTVNLNDDISIATAAVSGVVTASGGFVGNITGDVTGNAATATALASARTLGGVSFDGSANINLPGVNATGNQDTSGNAATATALQSARTIGGVSFDGTGNINLPGVNAAGNQDTTGTAALAEGLTGTPNVTVGIVTASSMVLSGDLTVNGTTTTINSTTLTVDDKNIELGSTSSPTDASADGGGITLKGSTDHTFNWVDSSDSWTSSENMDLASAKTYKIAGTDVLSATTLGSAVVNSSLTSVGTLGSLNVSGAVTGDNVNLTGVATATTFDGNLTGFDELTAPHSATTKNYAVTVVSKTAAHRYNGSGSSLGYTIDGVESPFLTLTPGRTYRFTLSSSDMSSHPFRFYLDADRNTAYTTNVTTTSTYAEITVTDTTPAVLHYQCSAHALMGNAFNCNSNTVNTPAVITGASGANITGTVTATTFSGSGASLTALNASNIASGTLAAARLADSGVSAGSVGSSTAIPVLTIDAKGRITSTSTASLSTDLTVAGDSGSNQTITSSETLTVAGGDNVTTTMTDNQVSIGLDSNISVTSVNATGVITATTFDGSFTGNISGTASTATNAEGLIGSPSISVTNITIGGELIDGDGNFGTSGQILSSDGADTKWITSGDLTAGATALVGVTNTTANATHYLTFVDTASGQENIRVDTDLTYNPSTNTLNAGTFNSTSDITLKDNVSIIDNALDMINNLDGISWNWKKGGQASLGVSAQNVETVAPELVSTCDSHKAVNYNGLIGILIEAVKEQGNQITELRTELAKKANSRRKRS
jgi:hypothetical protein